MLLIVTIALIVLIVLLTIASVLVTSVAAALVLMVVLATLLVVMVITVTLVIPLLTLMRLLLHFLLLVNSSFFNWLLLGLLGLLVTSWLLRVVSYSSVGAIDRLATQVHLLILDNLVLLIVVLGLGAGELLRTLAKVDSCLFLNSL